MRTISPAKEVEGLCNIFEYVTIRSLAIYSKKSLKKANICHGPAHHLYTTSANIWNQCMAMGLPSGRRGT